MQILNREETKFNDSLYFSVVVDDTVPTPLQLKTSVYILWNTYNIYYTSEFIITKMEKSTPIRDAKCHE